MSAYYKHRVVLVATIGILLCFLGCVQDDDVHLRPPAQPPVDSTLVDTIPPDTLPTDTLPTDTVIVEPSDTIRFNYLALGDSYTIGTGLPNPEGRFPVQLVSKLNAEGNFVGETPRIIAQNGWTTGSLLGAIANANIDTTYSLVSLLIGVNNQFQNRPIAEYTEQFELLLTQAIAFANDDAERVFVVSIPDYGVTPFGQGYNPAQIAAAIDQYNGINQSITESYGVSYYNITEISRTAGANPGMLAPDNLHPSGQQYGLWVDSFYEQVKLKLHD